MADLIPIPQDESVQARFWAKVDVRGLDDCWHWQAGRGSVDKSGRAYGRFYCKERRKSRPASQVAWELHNRRPFPSGMNACHSCDNPSCVNPAHIWPGTQLENILDCISKGRTNYVYKTHCIYGHKLTVENPNAVRRRTRCLECGRKLKREWAARNRLAMKAAASDQKGLRNA